MKERDFVKTNMPGFLKDKHGNMVINKNTSEYDRIRALRRQVKENGSLRQQVDRLQKQMAALLEKLGIEDV